MTARVLYVLGAGRSGSTIFGNVLGSCEGAASVGEVYFIWDRGFGQNVVCGCGSRFFDCPFWNAVVEESGLDAKDSAEMLTLRARVARTRALLPHRDRGAMNAFKSGLTRLYSAMSTVADADYLVDTSKLPAYANLLRSAPGVDLFALHLIRDPRAVAYSWSRTRHASRSDVALGQKKLHQALAMWIPWNILAEFLWRQDTSAITRIRYEDFVANPTATLKSVDRSLGGALRPGPVRSGSVSVTQAHTLTGNPSRFRSGDVRLSLDNAWVDRMPRFDLYAATAATWPMLVRYGYPVWQIRRDDP